MRSRTLRLDRDVERGRRLVADEQLRVVGECDREHDALALAAGELVRVGPGDLGRAGQPDLLQQRDDPLRTAPRRVSGRPPRPAWMRIVSATWAPTRIVGLSAVIGSWKTIDTSLPRTCAMIAFARADDVVVHAGEAHRAGHAGPLRAAGPGPRGS